MKQSFPILAFVVLFIFQGCMSSRMVRVLQTPENFTTNAKNKFLKVHIKDGSLYLLEDWNIDTTTEVITGTGSYYNFKRDAVSIKPKSAHVSVNSRFTVCWNDVSLLETNQLQNHSGNMAAITIVGVPLAIISSYCLTNPKACFGSCPTFYTLNNGKWNLSAEGFSSSILPVFEKRDVDMLFWTENTGDTISLKVTNEALETHMIRYADLMIFPHHEGERIFATQQGDFYSVESPLSPIECKDVSGNCLYKVENMDHVERYSLTDSKNLAKKEEIIVSFDNEDGKNQGLIIGSRQTLLTTYLFYQGLAYSGSVAGYIAANIENGNETLKKSVEKLWDKLGSIEIFLKNKNGDWTKIEDLEEMGPIAADVHLVKLPQNIPANATIKLRMTQGLWRIDYLALGKIKGEESPLVIHPEYVIRDGKKDDGVLKLLNDTSKYLITYPGDVYFINYKFPGNGNYECFLHSKGYYLEWMRDEWLAEQNLRKARFMFAFPGIFMRKSAKEFKNKESEMEDSFWGSRYVQK